MQTARLMNRRTETMTDWTGKRVLILGAARQGLALARWLTRHGARVTVSDRRSAEDLSGTRATIPDLDVTWEFGGHPTALLDHCDVVCLSGGVPVNLPIVREATRRQIPLSNDTQIFMEAVPCQTIGITGSAGKTTTTTLVGMMAKCSVRGVPERSAPDGQSAVYVGGNIGDPLINYVDAMKPDDIAVLEISSFQLEQITLSPQIAAILNITPDHLDRHGTMDAYSAAKARILEFQRAADSAILGRDDPNAWGLRSIVKGRLYAFSLRGLEPGLDGAYLQEDHLCLRAENLHLPVIASAKLALRGDHNVRNVLAALAIGQAAGFTLDAMLDAVEGFHGVPHRLEFIRTLRGVRWYNDSIATAPERTMAALRSFDEPLVLLLGGRDKDLSWEDLAAMLRERVDHLVLFGEAAEKIAKVVADRGSSSRPYSIEHCQSLRDAFLKAAEVAEPGDVVLLSPGGTSYDEFKDFEERGERFKEWVRALS